MSGCRIGKVKLKSGGEVHVLPLPQRDALQTKFLKRASKLSNFFNPGEIGGFAMVIWALDGTYTIAYHIQKESIVNIGLAPTYVADVLRREMLEVGDWETPS